VAIILSLQTKSVNWFSYPSNNCAAIESILIVGVLSTYHQIDLPKHGRRLPQTSGSIFKDHIQAISKLFSII